MSNNKLLKIKNKFLKSTYMTKNKKSTKISNTFGSTTELA